MNQNHCYERQGSLLNQQINMGKASQQQKNIISPQNIQLIEQIGQGEFGTGRNHRLKNLLFIFFSPFLVFKAFWRTKQNELVSIKIENTKKKKQIN